MLKFLVIYNNYGILNNFYKLKKGLDRKSSCSKILMIMELGKDKSKSANDNNNI